MSAPVYAFTRREDGPNETIYAQYLNELQAAIEEISARAGGGSPRMISGRLYTSLSLFSTASGWGAMSLIPDTSICVPIPIWSPCTIDRVGCYVTTAAGTACRLGLYADDGSIGPGALLASGTIDPGTTGLKLLTVSVAIATPQIIWAAMNPDSNSTAYESIQFIRNRPLGMDASTRDFSGLVKTSDGAGSSLPNPFSGSDFWNGSSDQIPHLYVRIA